jgi:hypothetical protein
MAKQMLEKCTDIQAREIPSPKLKVESQTLPFRRYGQRIDSRNTTLFVKVVKEGRLSLRGPGASNVRNEQEARFIEEDQMGPTSVGVFLYGANDTASNARSLLRFAVKLAALASDSSIPDSRGASTRGSDDIERRTVGRSLSLPGLRSISRFDTRQPEGHLKAPEQVAFFDLGSAWGDVQVSAGASVLEPLSLGRPEATGTRNLQKHSKRVLWLAGSCPSWTNEQPADAAFPAALRSHRVSCPLLYSS